MSQRTACRSDLTDKEGATLEPLLKKALYGRKRKPIGAPRKDPLREIVNAILYGRTTGCLWYALPNDLPPWKTVSYHFRRWRQLGVWDTGRDARVQRARAQAGKEAPHSVAVDSQSVS